MNTHLQKENAMTTNKSKMSLKELTGERSEDRQLSIDELAVVAGGQNCVAGKHIDEATITSGSTGGGIISSIQTFVQTYFSR
jgi:hypothetical protein